jgi:hypothetical protein
VQKKPTKGVKFDIADEKSALIAESDDPQPMSAADSAPTGLEAVAASVGASSSASTSSVSTSGKVRIEKVPIERPLIPALRERQQMSERELGLMQRIMQRVGDPEATEDPVKFGATLRNLIENSGNVPLDLIRDVICYQVEIGDITADSAVSRLICH